MRYSLFPTYKKLCLTCKINFKYVLFNVFNQKKLETISLFEVKFIKEEIAVAVKPIFLIEHENKYFAFFYKLDLKKFDNYKDLVNSVNLIELSEKELKDMKGKIIKHDTDLEKFIATIKAEYFSKKIFNQSYIGNLDSLNQTYATANEDTKRNWWTLSLLILFICLFISSTGLTVYAFSSKTPGPIIPWGVPKDIEERLESKSLGKQKQIRDVELALANELFTKGYSEEQVITTWNTKEQKIIVEGNKDVGFTGEVVYSYSLWKDLNQLLNNVSIEGYKYETEIDDLIETDLKNAGLSMSEVIIDKSIENQTLITGIEDKEVFGSVTYKYVLWTDINSIRGITSIQRGSSHEEIIQKIKDDFLLKGGATVTVGEPKVNGTANYREVTGDPNYGFIGTRNIVFYLE